MAPRRGGGSSRGGDGGGGGSSSIKGVGATRLLPVWGNLALLVITAIALAAMLPLLIAVLKIKTKKSFPNLNRSGFIALKWNIRLVTLYVSPCITQTPPN